jgi:adenylate cyclase
VFTGAVAGIEYSILGVVFRRRIFPYGTRANPYRIPASSRSQPPVAHYARNYWPGNCANQETHPESFVMIQERNRIRRTFGEYVFPVVMDKLLTIQPHLRSELRTVCVMFLDIRNFTAFAEKQRPEAVVAYLESLFEFMIEIVNRHHGVINKFLGDGFMAVFGAPLSEGADSVNSVEAAREILPELPPKCVHAARPSPEASARP